MSLFGVSQDIVDREVRILRAEINTEIGMRRAGDQNKASDIEQLWNSISALMDHLGLEFEKVHPHVKVVKRSPRK